MELDQPIFGIMLMYFVIISFVVFMLRDMIFKKKK